MFVEFFRNHQGGGEVREHTGLNPSPKIAGNVLLCKIHCCTFFLLSGCSTPNLSLQHQVATLHHLFFQDKTTEFSFSLTTEQVGTACTMGIFSQVYDNHFKDSM